MIQSSVIRQDTILVPRLSKFCIFFLGFLLLPAQIALGIPNNDERYSFSLTTFDPKGNLGQVERAQQAASMGTPVIAMTLPASSSEDKNGLVILASPQVLPGVFMVDDGTPRFTRLTDELVVAHSGLTADGRVLVAAAQRMAVEHEYTFDEEIDCGIFLEEMSLLMQEYTMKPATRPFGASLVVAYLPSRPQTFDFFSNYTANSPQLFRIDPSGSVEPLGELAIVHGNNHLQRAGLQEKLEELQQETLAFRQKHQADSVDEEQLEKQVVALVRESLNKQSLVSTKDEKDKDSADDFDATKKENWTILTACLSSDNERNYFSRKRHDPES